MAAAIAQRATRKKIVPFIRVRYFDFDYEFVWLSVLRLNIRFLSKIEKQQGDYLISLS